MIFPHKYTINKYLFDDNVSIKTPLAHTPNVFLSVPLSNEK